MTDEEMSRTPQQPLPATSGQPDPTSAPPIPRAVVDVAEEGLGHRSGERKRVLIIGAGMAGLVAAYELRRQGHEPVVLEAQNRVGGRVYTLRDVRARPLRRGRRHAHPARARPDARVLPPVRAADAAVRHGQPQGARLHRRRSA